MVSHLTCLTILLIASLTRSSNPNCLFTRFPKRLSISAFPSLAHTQITRFCNAVYPHLNIRSVVHSYKCISAFFPFKDKVPKFLRSGVVYLFKCRCCITSYVGQTKRHLHTRVSEHLGLTPIIGRPSSSPVMSSIFSHLNTTGHSANFDDFKILSSCSDNCELMIHKSSNPLLTSRAALFCSTFCNSSAIVSCLLCLLICICL